MTHWTTGSPEESACFAAADFMTQIELTLEDAGIEKKRFAAMIGVDPSRVSQLIHNPGNLQIDTMAKCTRALGKKLAIVVYHDGDPGNLNGPISGDVFRDCWKKLHEPKNRFALEGFIVARTYSGPEPTFYRPFKAEAPKLTVWGDVPMAGLPNETFGQPIRIGQPNG